MANDQLMSAFNTKPEPQKKQQEQLKAQTKSEITPVKSSLPPMPQAGMASASQVSAATKDPRFTQAITKKYQEDVTRQTQAVKQPVLQTQPGVNRGKIAELLNTINNPSSNAEAVAQATSDYQQLMAQQAPVVEESPESKAARANLMALSRLSGGAQLASAYGVGPVTGATAAGLQPNETLTGTLTGELMNAKKAALAAERDAAISEQQLQLEKNRLAQLKAFGGVAAAGEQAKLLRELSGRAESDKTSKEDAFTRVKEGILLGEGVNRSDLTLLGITPAQASELISFDLDEIEGLIPEGESIPDTLAGLETAVKNLRSNISQDQMTQEQKDFINYYDRIQSEFTRNMDLTSEYAYATPEQKARINALRRLTGQSDISEDAIGGGAKSGKVELSPVFKEILESDKARATKDALEKIKDISVAPYDGVSSGPEMAALQRETALKKAVDVFNREENKYTRQYGYFTDDDDVYKYATKYGFDKAGASHMKNIFKDVLKRERKLGNPDANMIASKEVQKILQAELDKATEAANAARASLQTSWDTSLPRITKSLNILEEQQ